jgi:methyl-accepting chemotaxis protein
MAKFRKNMVVSEKNYSGSGFLRKVSFSGKLYLALFLLLAGLFVLFSMVISHLYEYRNDIKEIAVTRRANDDFVQDLYDNARDILGKIYMAAGLEITIDVSNDLAQMQQTLQNLSNNLEGNVFSKAISNTETIINQFNEKAVRINTENYRIAENLCSQITLSLNDLEKVLAGYYKSNYQEILVILVIKLIIIILTLLFGILICKWIVKCAIQSIDEPADRIIRVLQSSNGDLKVKIPIISSEGLGATGLLLNAGISKWHELALEFKNASNKLNYLIDELTSGFNQVFLLEAQLQGAYHEIEASLNEQRQMGEKVDQEIKMIISELTELQYIPRKISQISEELNSLLTVNDENLHGLLNRQIEKNNEPHNIVNYLKDLSATSERVDRITRELEEIEAESEMLAFNSAISAARAGEEGQGFSVVAKEIANLVERSKKASTNLSSLISQIQVKTEEIVGIAPENELIEGDQFSLERTITEICSNLSEASAKCLNEINLMQREVQIIFDKSNKTFEEICAAPELTLSKTKELDKIRDIIGRYLDSLKHTGEINSKICETVNQLQLATNLLINQNS